MRTLIDLIKHFTKEGRFILLPMLLVLLLGSILLVLTSGLAYVAPFVYTLF